MTVRGWMGAGSGREGRISNPLRPVMRKSRLPRILVQFTNPSMLLESTVWKRLPEPVPSQAANKKEAQWGLSSGLSSLRVKDVSLPTPTYLWGIAPHKVHIS